MFWRNFAAGDAFVERFADVGRSLFEHFGGDVFEYGAIAAECGGVGDAASHRASADYANCFHFHFILWLLSLQRKKPRRVIVQNFLLRLR